MTTFGHRQLSLFFLQVLDVSEDGISYQGRAYGWNDIKTIEVNRGSFASNAFSGRGKPKAKIFLTDGKVIRINGRALERADKKPKIDKLSAESDAFIELIEILRSEVDWHAFL